MKFVASCCTIQVLILRITHGQATSDFVSRITERAIRLSQIQNIDADSKSRHLSETRSPRYPKLLPGNGIRLAEDKGDAGCDHVFFECLGDTKCGDCFFDMKSKDVDWAGVSKKTECPTVIATLQKASICTSLAQDQAARDLFCKTFSACVLFDDTDDSKKKEDSLDCSALTECKWPGMHETFLGDGVCHDKVPNSCYNTAVCKYDGGDCCEDTCETEENAYLQCGTDGFACRDTNSTNCDSTIEKSCPHSDNDDDNTPLPVCTEDQTLYKLVMYDSFGDGWEKTTISITQSTGATVVYSGGLKDGAKGTEYLCLEVKPTCYSVDVGGGNWGREASWDIRGFAEGSPAIAQGGGAIKCEFGVAGGSCANTCFGSSNQDRSNDQDYKDFKTMSKCIEDKCMIQTAACKADDACTKCFQADVPDYCFSIEPFLAVADCSVCKCTNSEDSDFCTDKAAPGTMPITPKNGGTASEPKECTPAETLDGANALIDFHDCMEFDKESMLLEDFDQNNFGAIDSFEACAHGFKDEPNHGGRTAKSCLEILVNAMEGEEKEGEPTQAIAEMAKHLYASGEAFCDCAKKASDRCPLCPSFNNFKTLLYETLDACAALDDIDCDAWDEFQKPCKVNMMAKFGSVDFMQGKQCDYIESGCESAGPFPSFRRLDCELELPLSSWDFYTQYSNGCVGDPRPVAPPEPAPVVAPTTKSITKPPTPYTPVKPSNIQPSGGSTPYVPKDKAKPTYRSPDSDSSSSHWFRNLVLLSLVGGVGYFLYKKRSDGFSFVRYRRMPTYGNSGMGDSDMYSGLALESSTNFEPPSLPPTPLSMPTNGGYGA